MLTCGGTLYPLTVPVFVANGSELTNGAEYSVAVDSVDIIAVL